MPPINTKPLGAVAGIVGAGGNAGAVAAEFLIRAGGLSSPRALLILGSAVTAVSLLAFSVRFFEGDGAAVAHETEARLAAARPAPVPEPA